MMIDDDNKILDEAYKILRANILFSAVGKKLKTIALVSYSPSEGKTTTSINLSIAMAKAEMNVLYVDADLRKSIIYKDLPDTKLSGLSEYLLGEANISDIINKTSLNHFSYVNCGKQSNNSAELLSSDRFDRFLKDVEGLFDIIIIDTPPLGSVVDGRIIASKTDQTIIVIEANRIKSKNVIDMKKQLLASNAQILGVVLNKINKTDYKGYYGSYDYYGSKHKDHKKWFNRKKKMTKKEDQK
jgi:capsular exopolysaccharide family